MEMGSEVLGRLKELYGVDIGEPTVFRTCPRQECERKVGPYYNPRAADAAIEFHIYAAHTLTPRPFVR